MPYRCGIEGTITTDSWPASITWGKNLNENPPKPDRFKVEFFSNARTCDAAFDWAENQFGGQNRAPRETRQLDEIRVWNTSTGSDVLMRKYLLRYGACDAQQSVLSDASIGNTSGDPDSLKLTLREIQRVGKDGSLHPAITRLTYQTMRGTQFYPNGGWNRLASVDNGQGGTVSFAYDNIGLVLAPDHNASRQQFMNNHRVKTKTVTDGRGNSYVWRYSYATPAYNSLGAGLDARSPQQWPTSATLYANSMAIPDADNTPSGARHSLLFAKPFKEFRGHSYVGSTAFSFNVPVSNGAYTVKLHFAENDHSAANQRRFDVNAEGGTKEVTNLDVYAAAGGQHKALVRSFDISVSDGAMTLDFIRQLSDPFVNAIEILPAGGTGSGGAETYRYDADGARVKRTHGSTTTFYFGVVYEEDLNPTKQRAYYTLNKQVVAMREGSAITHLYNDHLGSGSVAVRQSDGQVSKQEFTPWGKVRTGGLGTNTPNYTGQKLDDTGLLFYNARFYDPALGRFISADSVVPGDSSGRTDNISLKSLTVDFHEPNFTQVLAEENQRTFWFLLDEETRADEPVPWGPQLPQLLNRYSYVNNNPLRYTDPTGHAPEDEAPIDLGNGYRARVDFFNIGGQAVHEIHVFKMKGGKLVEIGVLGRDGWIARHGHSGQPPKGLNRVVWDKLNGINVHWMRSCADKPSAQLPPNRLIKLE